MDKGSLMSIIRHKDNPFLSSTNTALGCNLHIANNEEMGTNLISSLQLSEEDFITESTKHMSNMLQLAPSGRKALMVLIWLLQKNQPQTPDTMALDRLSLEEFMQSSKAVQMTIRTFQKGLIELEAKKIIARTMRRGIYYINTKAMPQSGKAGFTTLIRLTQ